VRLLIARLSLFVVVLVVTLFLADPLGLGMRQVPGQDDADRTKLPVWYGCTGRKGVRAPEGPSGVCVRPFGFRASGEYPSGYV